MHKRWTTVTLVTTAIVLCLVAALVIFIDPFFDYHKPVSSYGYLITNEAYQNPGLARHFDYDAILFGSSMVQNFNVSEFDQAFNVRTIKLSYSGASFYNIKRISDIAFDASDIKIVFWGVDTNRLEFDPNDPINPLPEYIYSPNKIDDIKYVFNNDVIRQTINTVKRHYSQVPNTSMDTVYEWYSNYIDDFDIEGVMQQYLHKIEVIAQEDIDVSNAAPNLQQNIVPIIEENPDTRFIMFFPPYSVMYWDIRRLQGSFDENLQMKESLIKTLLQYDNVEMYDFQADESIVCDISKYKDMTHYHPDINSFMIKAIAEGRYLVTRENYRQKIDDLYSLVLNTDVPALLKECAEKEE